MDAGRNRSRPRWVSARTVWPPMGGARPRSRDANGLHGRSAAHWLTPAWADKAYDQNRIGGAARHGRAEAVRESRELCDASVDQGADVVRALYVTPSTPPALSNEHDRQRSGESNTALAVAAWRIRLKVSSRSWSVWSTCSIPNL